MSFLVLTLFILAMIAFAILRSSAGLRQWWRQRSSAAWPWAKIKVESGEIEHVYGGDGGAHGRWGLDTHRRVFLNTVEAQRYTGTYACSFPSKSEAADLLKSCGAPATGALPAGTAGDSALEPYRDAGLALQPGFGNSDQYF